MRPLLYSFRRCPYAIRARMALAAAEVEVEQREVKLSDKPPEMLALSAKGTVPVLRLANGEVLDESLQIMRWALGQNDPQRWLENCNADTEALIAANDGEFKYWLDRYKYHVRHPEQSQQEYRQRADAFLSRIENGLEHHGGHLANTGAGLADVAIFPFVRQFAGVEPEWWAQSPYPAVRSWLDGWRKSALFTQVMAKRRK